MRFVLLLALFFFTSGSYGQVQLSFEPDSNGLSGWSTVGGKSGIYTLKMIGAIPFSATQGSYFMVVENDSLLSNPKGKITDTFPFTGMVRSVYYDAFYWPVAANQFGLIQIRLLKNGTDLINHTDTIKPIFSGIDTLALKWSTRSFDLPLYLPQPDTCIITITGDNISSNSGKPQLFIDHIRFSQWNVGVRENLKVKASVFPNPSSSQVTVKLLSNSLHAISIADLTGKEVMSFTQPNSTQTTFDVSHLNNGLYTITIQLTDGQIHTEKLVIWK